MRRIDGVATWLMSGEQTRSMGTLIGIIPRVVCLVCFSFLLTFTFWLGEVYLSPRKLHLIDALCSRPPVPFLNSLSILYTASYFYEAVI